MYIYTYMIYIYIYICVCVTKDIYIYIYIYIIYIYICTHTHTHTHTRTHTRPLSIPSASPQEVALLYDRLVEAIRDNSCVRLSLVPGVRRCVCMFYIYI